jgi:predicted transposase/invertase (TIGR01784 family)
MQVIRAKFLNPKADIVFKKIFGGHPDLIMSFLNGVLPLPDDGLIETIEYLPSEQVPTIPGLKNTIVDVKCTDQKGRIFIVEMQMQWNSAFTNRLLYGTSKAYTQQLGTGGDYTKLCPVYGLAIVNDIFDKETDEWFHRYRLINDTTGHVIQNMELMFIELQKFKPDTKLHRKIGVLWLRFLKEIDGTHNEIPSGIEGDPDLNKAIELLQESSYTLAELDTYDRYWDAVSVEKTHISGAFADGRVAGINEGIEKGMEVGIEIGVEKGKAEGREEGANKALLKTARAMHAKGMTLELISDVTGLSVEKLKECL